MTLIRAILYAFVVAALANAQQSTVFKRNVFLNATSAQASGPLPNIGQAVHIVTLQFPTAVADVDSFVVRFEASFDNATFFPISEDIISAKYNGSSFAYVVQRCNGVYPYVRLRIVTPAAIPMTAHYTGSIQPIGIVRLSGDRYIVSSPLSGATVAGLCLNIDGNCYIDGKRVVPLVPSDWTSVELLGSTVRTNAEGFINLYQPQGTVNQWQMVCRSIPSPPYDLLFHWQRNDSIAGTDPQSRTGILLRESSTGKLWAYIIRSGGGSGTLIELQKWSNPSTPVDTVISAGIRLESGLVSLRLTATSTTRSFSMPDPSGTFYSKIMNFGQAVANNDYFTTAADQICFGFGVDNGNYAGSANFVGYEEL